MDIDLTDAVAAVRDELLDAAQRASGKTLTFAVGPIEMEFAVELKRDAKAKAGFKAWVVSADVEAGRTRAATQKVKLTLTPKRPDGRELLIADDTDYRQLPTPQQTRVGR